MANLSENLTAAVARAADLAQIGSSEATTEHMLLALLDDADAEEVLTACRVDTVKLRDGLEKDLGLPVAPVATGEPAALSPRLKRVIHRAIVHVQFSGQKEVTGAHVLIALFAEKDCMATYLLQEQEMTRVDAVQFVHHRKRKGKKPLSSRGRVVLPNAKQDGIALRDWFAGQALIAIGGTFANAKVAAQAVYEIADAMMEAREENGDKDDAG